MALYAIGDLYLHFQTDLRAKAQMKDRAWKNHEQKFRKNCEAHIQPGDTLVLTGKGHETYQIVGKTKHHMDEREIVAEVLGT